MWLIVKKTEENFLAPPFRLRGAHLVFLGLSRPEILQIADRLAVQQPWAISICIYISFSILQLYQLIGGFLAKYA